MFILWLPFILDAVILAKPMREVINSALAARRYMGRQATAHR